MTINLDHTIVPAADKEVSARFLADILDLKVGHVGEWFTTVASDNGVTLDYYDGAEYGKYSGPPLHFAFVVSEDVFDAALPRIVASGAHYYSHPHKSEETAGTVSRNADGGRGVYFNDPDGHAMELMVLGSDPDNLDQDFWPEPYPPREQ